MSKQSAATTITFIFLSICAIALCLAIGATSSTTTVELCDYSQFDIIAEQYVVSEDELRAAMSVQLSLLDEESTPELTDSIVQKYFGCKTVHEFKTKIINEIIEHRVFESVYSYLIENSFVSTSSCDEYVNNVIEQHLQMATFEGISFADYLAKYYGTDVPSMRESLSNMYIEMQIVFAFIDSKSIIISPEDRDSVVNAMAQEDGTSKDRVIETYGLNYIDFIIAREKTYSIITNDFHNEIEEILVLHEALL